MNGEEKHFKEKAFLLAISFSFSYYPYSYASKETLETKKNFVTC